MRGLWGWVGAWAGSAVRVRLRAGGLDAKSEAALQQKGEVACLVSGEGSQGRRSDRGA